MVTRRAPTSSLWAAAGWRLLLALLFFLGCAGTRLFTNFSTYWRPATQTPLPVQIANLLATPTTLCWSPLGSKDPVLRQLASNGPPPNALTASAGDEGRTDAGLRLTWSPEAPYCRELPSGSQLGMNTAVGHVFGAYDRDSKLLLGVLRVKAGQDRFGIPAHFWQAGGGKDFEPDLQEVVEEALRDWLLRSSFIEFANDHRDQISLALVVLVAGYCLLVQAMPSWRRVGLATTPAAAPKTQRETASQGPLRSLQMFKGLATLLMVVDHLGRVYSHDHRHWMTFPAQFGGALWFYYLSGSHSAAAGFRLWFPSTDCDPAAEAAWRRRTAMRTAVLAVLFAVMHWLLTPAGSYVQVWTLLTLAVSRFVLLHIRTCFVACVWLCCGVWPGSPPAAFRKGNRGWNPLHLSVAMALGGVLFLLDSLLGYEGLRLAYGSRFVMFALAGFAVELRNSKALLLETLAVDSAEERATAQSSPAAEAAEGAQREHGSTVRRRVGGGKSQPIAPAAAPGPISSGTTRPAVVAADINWKGLDATIAVWLAGAVALSLYLNQQNVVLPNLRREVLFAAGCAGNLLGMALTAWFMLQYRANRVVPNVGRLPSKVLQWAGAHSLSIYFVHLAIFWTAEWFLHMRRQQQAEE